MMKNAQIIAAWDSILPDAAAETRIRSAVLAYGEKKRSRKWHRYLIPVAACLLLIAAGYRFRLTRPLHAELDNGMRITYHATQNGIGEAMYAYDYEICERELTAEELHRLLPCSAQPDPCHAVFRAETGAFLRAETKIGEVHVHLAREGLPVTDVIVTGETSNAEIGGVPVTFGYFLTKPNSRGIRTAVLYAAFMREGLQVYLETGGDEAISEQLGADLGNLVCELLRQDAPDLSEIRYDNGTE